MPKYVIERHVPGVGNMTVDEKQDGARKSNAVIDELGAKIEWVHSYVTPDKIDCIYLAPNKETIQQHAELSGFPADQIEEVRALIDLTSAH